MRDEPFDSKLDSCEVSFDSPPSTLRVSFFFHHERLQQANFVWLTGFHSKSQDHLFIIDHHFVEMSLTHRKKPRPPLSDRVHDGIKINSTSERNMG